MSDENNKKPNSNGQDTSPAGSSDEVFGSDIDLAGTGTQEETPREREIRLRDEERRRKEMEAIREDVERRYSLQVEEAISNADSIAGRSSSVKAGDGEVIDLEAFRSGEKPAEKKRKSKKASRRAKKRKRRAPVYFDLDEKPAVYRSLYSLGDYVINALGSVIDVILHILSIPVKKLRKAIHSATAGTKRNLNRSAKATAREVVYFHREVRSARKSIFAAFRKPMSIPPIIMHYIRKAIIRHKQLLRTVANTALPVLSLLILLAVFNYWNSVTFALNVIYNNQSVGYITDESVFIKARELVKDKLSANSTGSDVKQVAAPSLSAGYELALVSLDELSDARTISDRMIENSVDNLTNACGVYINGNFLCAVKNEADAKTVFYNILEPYEEDANRNGYMVGFAEDIDYVQGLYRDDPDLMWDALKLETTVLGKDGATAAYIVPQEQTLDEIADICGASVTQLLSLNPSLTGDEVFEAGESVTVPTTNRLVNIKKTVKSSKIASVPFETVTTRDATKYSGYRLVRQKGVNGTQRIITTRTYINDTLVDTSVHNEIVTPATDEKIVVGTMTTYGGIYIGMASDQGFLWPAPSCHYISSPYGWRSTGWHSGVDICTGNGTAMGTPVIAARSGTVEIVSHSGSGYGNMVVINHGDGYKTRYAHMMNNSITVRAGDYVEGGKVIGKVGSTGNSTGPHLHFEVIYNGETRNPADYIS